MVENKYDASSPESILLYAHRLTGKSLDEVAFLDEVVVSKSNKGDLGSLVEKYFFEYEPNSSPEPDFPEAGVELKTTGVKRDSSRRFRAKERLVLSMINFESLAQEDWAHSSLMKKNKRLLIIFYIYEKDLPPIKRKFLPSPILFEFPERDLVQIQNDWETIRSKVVAGKAHELSEGDTFYLAACRKGSGGPGEKLRSQPFSEVGAKSRAFSLKPCYVNRILDGEALSPLTNEGQMSIETATLHKFERFYGKSTQEISALTKPSSSAMQNKGFHRQLTMQMLDTNARTIPELVAADIELKTIRVRSNLMPREAMSFPTFSYLDIVQEKWEESKFCERIERKFLFVVFQEGIDGVERLKVAFFWSMPYEDRREAHSVWEKTRRRVAIDARNLPGSKESRVAHVRPKAKNAQDVSPTPQGTFLVKKCFWLNQSYIADVVRQHLPK